MDKFDKVYFKSKAIGKLSSDSLNELKSTLCDIDRRRKKIQNKIDSAKNSLRKAKSELSWINWFPLKLVFKKKVELKKAVVKNISEDLKALELDYEKHKLGLEILLSSQLEAAFGGLDDRFSEIIKAKKVWDITTSQSTPTLHKKLAN